MPSEECHSFLQGWGEANTSYQDHFLLPTSTGQDWELKVNLRKQLKFPETAATTMLRSDMVLISGGGCLKVESPKTP